MDYYEIKSFSLGYELYIVSQLINCCQQMVAHDLKDHPVYNIFLLNSGSARFWVILLWKKTRNH